MAPAVVEAAEAEVAAGIADGEGPPVLAAVVLHHVVQEWTESDRK